VPPPPRRNKSSPCNDLCPGTRVPGGVPVPVWEHDRFPYRNEGVVRVRAAYERGVLVGGVVEVRRDPDEVAARVHDDPLGGERADGRLRAPLRTITMPERSSGVPAARSSIPASSARRTSSSVRSETRRRMRSIPASATISAPPSAVYTVAIAGVPIAKREASSRSSSRSISKRNWSRAPNQERWWGAAPATRSLAHPEVGEPRAAEQPLQRPGDVDVAPAARGSTGICPIAW
jgi:hypothetical protein